MEPSGTRPDAAADTSARPDDPADPSSDAAAPGAAVAVDAQQGASPAMDAAWQKLLEEWADADAHKRFIAMAASLGELADAGRRYRELRDKDPDKAEEATKRLNAVVMAATAVMMEQRTPSGKKRNGTLLLALAVCSAMVVYVLWAFLGGR